MKTKNKPTRTPGAVAPRQKITDTTLNEVGMTISRFLDMMAESKVPDTFRQIYKQNESLCSLHAANEEMSIHFTIEWKGGKV